MKRAYLVFALFSVGCGLTPVDVQIGFPSRDSFLYSDFGRLLIYTIDGPENLGVCPSLVDQAVEEAFGMPELDSDWKPICDFRAGSVRFESVPPGPHAYVMVARDADNIVLLAGCVEAEAYEEAPPVQLDLFPTAAYTGATESRVLTCIDEEQRCGGGCQ